MTLGAIESLEDRLAGYAIRGQAAVRRAVRTRREDVQRCDIRGQRIQIGTEACLRITQRLVTGALVEHRIRHEPRASSERADLAFEVLHFVEVRAPVQEALATGPAVERHGVAQAFAETGHVPDAPVTIAVVVAAGAAQVALAGHPSVACVIEELLAAQHRR